VAKTRRLGVSLGLVGLTALAAPCARAAPRVPCSKHQIANFTSCVRDGSIRAEYRAGGTLTMPGYAIWPPGGTGTGHGLTAYHFVPRAPFLRPGALRLPTFSSAGLPVHLDVYYYAGTIMVVPASMWLEYSTLGRDGSSQVEFLWYQKGRLFELYFTVTDQRHARDLPVPDSAIVLGHVDGKQGVVFFDEGPHALTISADTTAPVSGSSSARRLATVTLTIDASLSSIPGHEFQMYENLIRANVAALRR
jgi:hypothetical protein